MSQERNHQLMQEGEQAVLIRGVIEPFIHETIRDDLKLLISMYRNGDTAHDKLVGKIAEIAALEKLLSDLDSKQVRGNVARAKEINNAAP